MCASGRPVQVATIFHGKDADAVPLRSLIANAIMAAARSDALAFRDFPRFNIVADEIKQMDADHDRISFHGDPKAAALSQLRFVFCGVSSCEPCKHQQVTAALPSGALVILQPHVERWSDHPTYGERFHDLWNTHDEEFNAQEIRMLDRKRKAADDIMTPYKRFRSLDSSIRNVQQLQETFPASPGTQSGSKHKQS